MFNGIVEDVDTGIKHAFHNRNELWQFVAEYKEPVLDQPVISDPKNRVNKKK